ATRPEGARAPRRPGHVDLAHTRRALEALRDAGRLDAATRARAERFLAVLQKLPGPGRGFDGGFYFSSVVLAANKGRVERGPQGESWRSYATATADGALALLAAGVSPSDERVLAAGRWLREHPLLERPE